MNKQIVRALFLCVVFLGLMSIVFAEDVCTTTGSYAVCTDQADYSPELTVHISGSGFDSMSQLMVKITRPDGSVVTGDGTFGGWPALYDSVQTDVAGNFNYDYVLDGILGTYSIEILDVESNVLATHTFTDATHVTTTTTLNNLPNTLAISQTGISFNGTVSSSPTVQNGAPVVLQYSTQSNFPGGQTTNVGTANTAGSNGGFSGTFTAPSTSGTYYFRAHFANYNVGGGQGTTWDASDSSTQTITVNAAAVCGNGITEGNEQCDGGACCNTDCTFKSASNVCRASAGDCDVAETCTGSAATCPANTFVAAGTSCNDGLFCNVNEVCDGSGSCGGGTARVCSGNNILGIDTCDDSSDGNPFTLDTRSAFTSICDETADSCTTGSSVIVHQTPTIGICGVTCLINDDCASLNDACAVGVCDLNTYTCAQQFTPATTECRASAGDCDVAESCTGTSATCPADIKSTAVCRVAADVCDVAESCDGVNNDCPANAFVTAGTSCDDGLFCNVNEVCDGSGNCGGGTARDCSGNNILQIAQCDCDATLSTFDWRDSFTSTCDETLNVCPEGDLTVNHVCADADNADGVYNYDSTTQTCSAECDGAGVECQPYIDLSANCQYGGSCNTDPSTCSCGYASNEYCPNPGTVTNGDCYYGTQSCDSSGCGLTIEAMGNYDTCDPTLGPIDTIPPTISCAPPDQSVWYGANVDVQCTASDNASGLANSSDASFTLSTNVANGSETASAVTDSHQVCDNSGNCATAGPYTFKVDRKAPVVSCGSSDGLWHGADVSIACTAADGGSGLKVSGDANFDLSTTVVDDNETDNAATGTHDVCDAVDNCVTAGPISGNKIDKKAPQQTACDSPDGIWHANDVTLYCYYSDGGSGPVTQNISLTTNVTAGTETDNAAASAAGAQACDAVGNCAVSPSDIVGNKVDKKSPTTTLTVGTPYTPPHVSTSTKFTLGAVDGGSDVQKIEYHFDSDGWSTYSDAFTAPGLGAHTLYYRATDNVGNVENTHNLSIIVGETSLTYSGDTSRQYSDAVNVKATLIELASGNPIQGKTITFTIGSQSNGSETTDSLGVATAAIILNQGAATTTVDSSFAGDDDYQLASDSDPFTIKKENTKIDYTGNTFVTTAGPTITTAPVQLSASLIQEADGYPGDLTKAKVTFMLIGPNAGSLITVKDVPVNAAGDALTTANVPVGTYRVYVRISDGNTYWIQNPGGTSSLVVDLGDNEQRVTGGGWIPDSLSTNGKDNFGFTVYYNKNGAPKGNLLFMFRGRDGYDYQLKSNSWAKGGLSFTGTNGAYFTAKATLSKINATTGEVVSSDGSYTFAVNIQDLDLNIKPVKTPDTFAITIFDSNSNIWKQVGTSGSQIALGGGNVVVHSK
jgi:hypothetical protein